MDAQLNLPERKYSYVLQDWMTSEAVETSYERSASLVNKRLPLKIAHRPIQRVARDCTEAVEEFMDSLPPPRAETEGPILVHTVDCKGIRMRPEERSPDLVKTEEKSGDKRMACAAQTYSIDPHYRSNEVIANSFFGPHGPETAQQKEFRRPEPLNRRNVVWLKNKKPEVFRSSSRSAKARIHAGTQEKLALMDGKKALRNLSREHFPGWTEALDLTHVVEKLRIAGQLHYGDGPAAEECAREATLLLLEGCVGDVIEDFETALEEGCFPSRRQKSLRARRWATSGTTVIAWLMTSTSRRGFP